MGDGVPPLPTGDSLAAERKSLVKKLGGDSVQQVARSFQDDLHGLLEAAEALRQSSLTPTPTYMDVDAEAHLPP